MWTENLLLVNVLNNISKKMTEKNARRDVIIDALANGRKRTVEIVDGKEIYYLQQKKILYL